MQRIKERYNLELEDKDKKYIIGQVNSGNCLTVTKENSKKVIHAYVKIKKIPIRAICAVNNKGVAIEVITALPFNVEEYNQLLAEQEQKDIENCIKYLKTNGYIVYKRNKKPLFRGVVL